MLLSTAAMVVATATATNCPCGYTINVNSTSHHFTSRLETDFLHVRNLSQQQPEAWIPQAYSVPPEQANGPFGKLAEVRNVVTNPRQSVWDWGGEGGVPDPGLQMWVTKPKAEKLVGMSEIVSVQGEMLYGSFRIGMKSTKVNGTCGAFFFYRDDEGEIDVEILSRQQQQQLLPSTDLASSNAGLINLVIQSPDSAQQGYVSPGSPDFQPTMLPGFLASEGYHEYRIDWFSDHVDFYVDSVLLSTITQNIPSAAGRLHVSHWSNGNSGWSAGPPGEDAVLTVSYVKAYFNTTEGLESNEGEACGGNRCVVPDQRVAPDPTGPDGNVTGRTFFFTDAIGSDTIGVGNRTSPKEGAAMSGRQLFTVVWMLLVFLVSILLFQFVA